MVKRHSSKLARVSATALLASCIAWSAHAEKHPALVLTRTIPLSNVSGGFNHMSVDDRHQRLFAPAPTDGMLEIVDLRSRTLWRSLPAGRPTTALYAPESGQLYLTGAHHLSIYDGSTLDRIANIDLQSRLDEIQYDAGAQELFVGRMTSGATGIAIVALPEAKLVASIALPSSPQGLALEQRGRRLFVNLPDDGAVAVIDRRKRTVEATWKLKGASDNFPIALDEKDGRLLIATRAPAEMLALDTRTGETIGRVPCVEDADDLWYDPSKRRVYISGGGGFVSVIEQRDPDRYVLLQRVRTAANASNSVFSARMQSLYVGVPPHEGGGTAAIRVYVSAP